MSSDLKGLSVDTRVLQIALSDLAIDSALQVRVRIRSEIVQQYADRMRAGDVFPPLTVFKVGEKYILVDGWHRYEAAKQIGRKTCPVEAHAGIREDALEFALEANSQHGLPMSTADKRHAVGVALKELGNRSDRYIADKVRVSPTFVGRIRRQLSTVDSSSRRGADGKIRKLPRKVQTAAKDERRANECKGDDGCDPAKTLNRIREFVEKEISAFAPAIQKQIIAETRAYLLQIAPSMAKERADRSAPEKQDAKDKSFKKVGERKSTSTRLSFFEVLKRVLCNGGRPMSMQEICGAAQPLLALTGTQGKTPLASLKSKLYLAVKAGQIIQEHNQFLLPEACDEN